jgi:HK97 family phage prohead protease
MNLKHVANALSRITVPFEVKADTVKTDERTFEGLAAVWTLDLGNDIIKKGAFITTIATWKKSRDAIPLLNSHGHYDVFSALGQMLEAEETKDGLWTKWEVVEGLDGDKTLARLRPSKRTGRPIVGKMSIGYEPVKYSYEQPEGNTNPWDRIRNLEEVKLKEVSLVMFPMAPGASVDASTVKQFLMDAQSMDPKLVSMDVKQDLRRLASRIGILLAPGKKDDDAETKAKCTACNGTGTMPDPAHDGQTMDCPTCDGTGKAPVPKKKDEDAPPEQTPTPTPAPTPAPTPTPAPKTPAKVEQVADEDEDPELAAAATLAGKHEEPIPPAESAYLYSEALQQRLQKVTLKAKVSSILNPL